MLGVFDSGVGGLSVVAPLRRELPTVPLLYVADQAHVPYGPRPLAEVRALSETLTRWLLAQGARLIVIACNTASAAALKYLRQRYPAVPFVGMEPAVKPAAEHTHTGVVGVLATPATFQGELFASVVERFAQGVQVIPQVCPGLVEQIEAGRLDTPDTEAMLRGWVEPLLAQGADTLVLGCTHYPFIAPTLQKIAGPQVRLVDPAPAVARQAARLYPPPLPDTPAPITYATTGDLAAFRHALARLGAEPGEVMAVR